MTSPEEWTSTTVAEIAARSPHAMATGPFGSAIGSRYFRPQGVPVIRGGNLSADPEVRLRDEGLVFLDPEKAAEFSRSKVRAGDLVFTSWGTINQVGLIDRAAEHAEYVISNKQMKLTPDTCRASSEFLYYLFSAPAMQREILDGAISSSIPGFNLARLRSIELRLPSVEEQDKIARAIADADELTVGLGKLVAKKRAIKQGMMQELLTGRTRLPGYQAEWTTLRVAAASHLKARIGWQGLTTSEYRVSGEHRLVGGTEFKDGRIDWDKTPFVDKWRFDQDTNIQLQLGDVLITKDGTIGKIAMVDSLPGPATLNSGVFVVRPKRNRYDSGFLFCMLRSRFFEEFVGGLSAGSTINHLYQRDLVTLEFHAPAEIAEQRAIAAVLLDADAEIQVLERRLKSALGIKRGIMQELLTGRTRLMKGHAA